MTRYRLTLAYDGRDFFGWQRLKDKPTVQGSIEAAIERSFGQRVTVQGAGRTDRGAHAEGQVASFALTEAVTTGDLVEGCNTALPPSIRALEAAEVAPGFHARSDAIGKDYEYRIGDRPDLAGRIWLARRPLELSAMQRAIGALVGTHDFASFATKPRFEQRSTECTLSRATVDVSDGVTLLRFSADRFLMHMVRNMVGAVAKVGEGRYAPSRIAEILAARDRSASPGSAPASGLYLMRVHYPGEGAGG